MDGRPHQGNAQNSQLLRRPPREDPPPPPPPSPAGFIQDFPVPQNFEEFISMNMWLGAICVWILKKLIGYFRGRNSSLLCFYAGAGPGSLVLCRLRARRRATKVEASPNLPIPPPLTVARSNNPFHQDSSLAYAVLQEHNSPAPTRLPRSQSTPPSNRRQPSRTQTTKLDFRKSSRSNTSIRMKSLGSRMGLHRGLGRGARAFPKQSDCFFSFVGIWRLWLSYQQTTDTHRGCSSD